MLRELCVLDTYEQAAEAYQAHVKELDGQAADVDSRLTCAYDFIDDVFGEGAEALVFTTELASRGCPARYLARFDSESYRAHSHALALDFARDEIYEEIEGYKEARREQLRQQRIEQQRAQREERIRALEEAQAQAEAQAEAETQAQAQQDQDAQQPPQSSGPRGNVSRYRSHPRRGGRR